MFPTFSFETACPLGGCAAFMPHVTGPRTEETAQDQWKPNVVPPIRGFSEIASAAAACGRDLWNFSSTSSVGTMNLRHLSELP